MLNLKSQKSISNTHPEKRKKPKREKRPNPIQDLSNLFLPIIQSLIDNPDSFPFRKPVNSDIIKNYAKIIKSPMTLEQVKTNITQLFYTSMDRIMKDLNLIASNCALYNGAGHPLTRTIESLVSVARQKFYSVIIQYIN